MNNLNEIWNLSQTNPHDDMTLVFDKTIKVCEIYHECYINNIWVSIELNQSNDSNVCKLLKKHTCDSIAKQMINVCMNDNDTKPIYSGELNKTSLRTSLYRQAGNLGQTIKTGIHDNVLYCMMNNDAQVNVTEHLRTLPTGSTTAIDIPPGTTVEKVRALVFNHGKRNNVKYSTRYIDGTLRVKRLDDTTHNDTTSTVSGKFVAWLDKMPWDVPLPVPKFEGLTLNSMNVTANRHFGGTFSFKDNFVTRKSFRLCKEKGHMTLRIKGVVVHTFNASRRTQLLKADWDRINDILSHYGVKSEVLL